ncbi:Transposon TX1 uncharacterized 149 kDa protein, partial [Linum grandiflorum]
LALLDLSPSGPLFTWTNRQTYEVKSRLDRFLFSPSWINIFPHTTVQHLSDNGSDHRAILLTIDKNNYGPKKYFSFDSRWLSNSEADSIISNAWRLSNSKGSKLFIFHSKLKCLRHNLVDWQKSRSTNSARKIKSLKDEIIRAKLGTSTNWDYIRNLESKLEQELRLEDSFWKQKLGINGFYKEIGTLNISTGLLPSIGISYIELSLKMTRVISGLLRKINNDSPLIILSVYILQTCRQVFFPRQLSPSLSKSVSSVQNAALIRPVSTQEIKQVVFSLGPNQAPGSDGFTGSFYREFWNLIHHDLCDAVRSFFVTGSLLSNINHTLISLIPKINNPTSMSHLRPISLCQFLYKIIAKILANRLSLVLPSVISSHQTGFVRDRRITDNIIIAHELMHFLKRKTNGSTHYLALKLDMEKAYDRIEWEFLFEMLRKLGFHRSFISWVQACITTVSYSVNFNGRRVGFLKPTRGL